MIQARWMIRTLAGVECLARPPVLLEDAHPVLAPVAGSDADHVARQALADKTDALVAPDCRLVLRVDGQLDPVQAVLPERAAEHLADHRRTQSAAPQRRGAHDDARKGGVSVPAIDAA